jgi:hypothetical protein
MGVGVVVHGIYPSVRVAFVGTFPKKKCGDRNRCSVGVQREKGCCFLSQMDDKS